jgi:copper transport protein
MVIVGAVALAAALLAAAPRPAEAHAILVSSTPAAGARLASAPAVVVLGFSEPVNRALSTASVVGPDGRTFPASSVDGQAIHIPLPTNTAGTYVVRWTSVSALDGHVLSGELRFGVGVTAGSQTATARPAAAVGVAVFRGLEDLALLLAVGLLVIGLLASREPALAWASPGRRLTFALGLALTAGAIEVAVETVSAASSISSPAAIAYLGSGLPGWSRAARLGAEAIALALSFGGWRRVAPALVAALAGVSLSGHAATVVPVGLGVVTDAVHLVSTGAWAGAILALATFRPPSSWRRGQGLALLRRFSPVALVAFAGTAVTGVLRGDQGLRGLSDLVATPYGQLLLLKMVVVGAMVALSLLAWRWARVEPRVEGLVAVAVVAVTAILTTLPPPGAAPQPAPAARVDGSAQALPRPGDVTLAASAGRVLVGMTLRPAGSGTAGLWLYVLPLEGPPAAGRLAVTMAAGGRPVALSRCGQACRRGLVEVRPGTPVEVAVGGAGGGVARLTMPALPAPDARTTVERSLQRMDRLRTFRIDESVRPASPPLRAAFAFKAPDQMTLDLSTGGQTVIIGSERYVRDSSAATWERQAAVPVKVPSFPWDALPPVAPALIGQDRVDGVPVDVVSFFEGAGDFPTWYQLWVGDDGLVRRADMETLGHFMTDRYSAFDAPLTIQAPVS